MRARNSVAGWWFFGVQPGRAWVSARPRGARRCLLAVLAAACTPLTLPAAAGLPVSIPQDINFTVEGKIARLSPGKVTLSAEGNIVFQVRYDDKTEITHKDGSKRSAKEFRVGMKLRVEGELTESGEVAAQRIEIQE